MIGQVVVSTEVAIGIAVAIVGSVAGALGLVFKLLVASYDARLAAVTTERDNWKQGMREAVSNLRHAANEKRVRSGKEPYEELEPVVPEHSSPATKEQREVAELQTVRAALVAATKDLGLPPRETDVTSQAIEVAEGAKVVADKLAEEKNKVSMGVSVSEEITMTGKITAIDEKACVITATEDGTGKEVKIPVTAKHVVTLNGNVIDAKLVNRLLGVEVGDSVSVSGTKIEVRS